MAFLSEHGAGHTLTDLYSRISTRSVNRSMPAKSHFPPRLLKGVSSVNSDFVTPITGNPIGLGRVTVLSIRALDEHCRWTASIRGL